VICSVLILALPKLKRLSLSTPDGDDIIFPYFVIVFILAKASNVPTIYSFYLNMKINKPLITLFLLILERTYIEHSEFNAPKKTILFSLLKYRQITLYNFSGAEIGTVIA
jgi:hypothetical protein